MKLPAEAGEEVLSTSLGECFRTEDHSCMVLMSTSLIDGILKKQAGWFGVA